MGVQEEPHSPRNTGDFGNTVQWMGVPPRWVGKEVRLYTLCIYFFFICYTDENKMEKTNKQTQNNLLEESVFFLSFLV